MSYARVPNRGGIVDVPNNAAFLVSLEAKVRRISDPSKKLKLEWALHYLGEAEGAEEANAMISMIPDALYDSLGKLHGRDDTVGYVRVQVYALDMTDPVQGPLAFQIKGETETEALKTYFTSLEQFKPVMGTNYMLPVEPNKSPLWWVEPPEKAIEDLSTPGLWGHGKSADRFYAWVDGVGEE